MSLLILSFIVIISSCLSMALLTLLERNVLGYAQLRNGPNNTLFMGTAQPLADVINLFSKESVNPIAAIGDSFKGAPCLALCLAFFSLLLFPSNFPSLIVYLGCFVLMCISSLNVYPTLMAGWISNSNYALLGGIRAVAQTVSYEVSIGLIIISALILHGSLELCNVQINSYFSALLAWPLAVLFFISCLAETNRAPLDFVEGESEIVSGFNVEYGSGLFALLLIAEYLNIIFISVVSATMFFPSGTFISSAIFISHVFTFIWVRGSLPRIRYDKLMSMAWNSILPFSLAFMGVSINL